MPLVFACIAPHGSIAIPEAKPKDRPALASATTAGMQELGHRFAAAAPDVSIVLTPHNIHVEGAMAVIDAAAVAGDLVQWGSPISLRIPVRGASSSVSDALAQGCKEGLVTIGLTGKDVVKMPTLCNQFLRMS